MVRSDVIARGLGADVYLLHGPQTDEAGALREILSVYALVPAATILFVRSSRGKPAMSARCPKRVWFNLSRAGRHTLVAVSLVGEVGIDIEDSSEPLDIKALERRALSRSEQAMLRNDPNERYSRTLVQYWCRKEAVLKAAGFGLSIQPEVVEVHAPADHATGVSLLSTPTGNIPMSWRDIDLRLFDPHLVATLAAPAARSVDAEAGPLPRGSSLSGG